MGARKIAVGTGLVLVLTVVCLPGAGAAPGSPQSSGNAPQASSSSSRQKPHRHRTTVAEEEGPQPELAKAEDLIQKRDFAQAESVLQKLLAGDPENYVGWFDLGFVENALDKRDDSIAAYRKSVAAKPDVFESNLISDCSWPRPAIRMRSSFFEPPPS